MRIILIICMFLLLVGCGLKSIPYSENVGNIEPNDAAQSHYNWGLAFIKDGNLTRAVTEFKLAIQNEPGWALPYFNLGAVYGNMGTIDRAILAWERATQLDPNFAKAYYNLAVAYSTIGVGVLSDSSHSENIEKSLASLNQAIRLDESALSAAEIEPAFDTIRNLPEYKELEHLSESNQ